MDRTNTSDTRQPAATRRALLDELAAVLRPLHKALLDADTGDFGPVSGPFQLLQLAANHPHFAWLRRLSELMTELDERRSQEDAVTEDEAVAFRAAVEGLTGPGKATSAGFRERYMDLLHRAPAVTMAHADLRRVLTRFPSPPSADGKVTTTDTKEPS